MPRKPGDRPPTTSCCAAGGPTPHETSASTTAGWPPTSCASRSRWVTVTSPPASPRPSRKASRWRRRCRRCAAWRCAAPGTPRAGGSRRLGAPGSRAAARPRRPAGRARVQAPAGARLGEPHPDRTGGLAARGRRADQRRRRQAAVHVAAHREHPPPPRVRQAGRGEPGCARRRRRERPSGRSRASPSAPRTSFRGGVAADPQAWMQGLNPRLEDRSPARLLSDGDAGPLISGHRRRARISHRLRTPERAGARPP